MRYMTLGLLALMAAGCSNEALEEVSAIRPANGEVQIAATISQGGNTRVAFTPDVNVVHAGWEHEDTITLYTEEQGRLYYVASTYENDTVFVPTDEKLTNIEGTTVYACYPAMEDADYFHINLPETYCSFYGNSNSDKEEPNVPNKGKHCPFLYAKGVIKNGVVKLEFNHLFAYLKLNIKAEVLKNKASKRIQAIQLDVTDNRPLSTYHASFNLHDQVLTHNGINSGISVYRTHNFSEGDLEVFIPVLPMEAGPTMSIKLQQVSGDTHTTLYTMKKLLPSTGFLAGHVHELTLGTQETVEVAYLVDGPTFNTRIKSLSGNDNLSDKDNNITQIVFKTEVNETMTGKSVEVSTDKSEGEIHASLNESDGVLTIYTSAKAIEIADASKLFYNLAALKSIDWGSVKVSESTTNTRGMFSGCSLLSNPDVSDWNTSNVTDMSYMFDGCSNIYALELASWDVSKVTNMSGMFSGCAELDTPDVSQWNTANVTDMSGMFSGCSFMLSLPLADWDVSKVTDMSDMFYNCTHLKQADVARWETSSVTDMSYMFSGCQSMTSPELSAWDVSKVTNMRYMFHNCGYTSLDLSGWNVSRVTDMSAMFNGYSEEGLGALDLSGWDVSKVENPGKIFNGNTHIQSLNVSNWNISNATSLTEMFQGCENLTSLDLSTWDVSNVTDMYGLFNGCSNLQSLDVSTWDVSKVKEMGRMFKNCSMQSLDISTWNVSRVTGMTEMFQGCGNLTSLDLSAWNVSRTTDMGSMFRHCNSLSALNISGWSLYENVECDSMFDRNGSPVHCTITATQATQEALTSKCTIDDTFSWVIVD